MARWVRRLGCSLPGTPVCVPRPLFPSVLVVLQANQYWVIYNLMGTPYFWLSLLLCPFVALLPDFLYNGYETLLCPASRTHISAHNWCVPARDS